MGAAILNMSESCFRTAVCFPPSVVSGTVGVRLRRTWVRSSSACVVAYFYDILGNVKVSG